MEYLRMLPKALPDDGRVLVHNQVQPRRLRLGLRGFRAWLQPLSGSDAPRWSRAPADGRLSLNGTTACEGRGHQCPT
jgi:hypothetical protein